MGWSTIKPLGEGSHGFVSLARSSPSPNDGIATALNLPPLIAVKSAPFSISKPLQFEREILRSLSDCPDIIKCYGADASYDEEGAVLYNMFLEYAAGGSLVDRIYSYVPFGEEEIREYTRSILRGLKYIHSKGMAHCDIKPDNILLVVDDNTGCNNAKICDLGIAKRDEEIDESAELRGTLPYIAPESILYRDYGREVDIWALGCTVFEMLVRNPLRDLNPDADIRWEVVQEMAKQEVDIPDWISEDARDFLTKCLKVDPLLRWSADRLLKEHPFVCDANLAAEVRGANLGDEWNVSSEVDDEELDELIMPMKLLKR